MTDEEFMKQIEQEWSRIDDDPDVEEDFFDFINLMEDFE